MCFSFCCTERKLVNSGRLQHISHHDVTAKQSLTSYKRQRRYIYIYLAEIKSEHHPLFDCIIWSSIMTILFSNFLPSFAKKFSSNLKVLPPTLFPTNALIFLLSISYVFMFIITMLRLLHLCYPSFKGIMLLTSQLLSSTVDFLHQQCI